MTEVKEKRPKKRYVYLDKYEKLEDRVTRIERWMVYLILSSVGFAMYMLINVIALNK